MCYILQTPGLVERIRAEIQPAFTNGHADLPLLEKCTLFASAWAESLRLVSSTFSVRIVEEETHGIGGYTLHKGAKIFCPTRPLHVSVDHWGEDAERYNPDRFIDRLQDAQSMKMRPFGGGPTLCPGRYVSQGDVDTGNNN